MGVSRLLASLEGGGISRSKAATAEQFARAIEDLPPEKRAQAAEKRDMIQCSIDRLTARIAQSKRDQAALAARAQEELCALRRMSDSQRNATLTHWRGFDANAREAQHARLKAMYCAFAAQQSELETHQQAELER